MKARLDAALRAEIGFVERLVWFWSNHFCVSADVQRWPAATSARRSARMCSAASATCCSPPKAIRRCCSISTIRARSGRTRSPASINTRGLNENLAREILELHTLGVRTVYTQDDVTSFAKVLTGWTIIPTATNPERGGEFVFNPRLHEPGPQTVIGKIYPEGGVEQGRAVLADLARHPATAAHVARKLARHFFADEPPPALVERLARRFLDTEGDLKEIAKALVEAPETWDAQRAAS